MAQNLRKDGFEEDLRVQSVGQATCALVDGKYKVKSQDNPLTDQEVMSSLATGLAAFVIPLAYGSEAMAFIKELECRMLEKFASYIFSLNERERKLSLAKASRAAFRETCDIWENKIIAEMYGGNRRAFHDECALCARRVHGNVR